MDPMEQPNDKQHDHLYKIRHSLAHVLAQAVLQIRPDAQLAFGPPIDDGCYYDFKFAEPLTPDHFADIESRMRKIIAEQQKFESSKMPAAEAIEHLRERGQHFKVEYCTELVSRGETEIGFYKNGPFEDMCAGPHLENTGKITPDCFKIDSIAGAYWRGSEKNPQLSRLYVLAFKNKKELEAHLERRRLAEERDHRKLGKELDLFSVQPDTVGGGLILWHPKGGLVRHLIESHCKDKHIRSGYDFVYTPHIGRSTLWQTSGHLTFYKDSMYPMMELEGQEYYLKPMNCPFHCSIFKSSLRSYKDLPKRFSEWGTVYRFERSGTLHGLTRVRGFTQDDAHLFCREDQMPEEIDRVLQFSIGLLRDFGLTNFQLYLSTRPEKRVGEERNWDMAEAALRAALKRSTLPFAVKEGDGAFYGPKIDICLNDQLGRQWQLSTIQFDFNLPDRFDLKYVGQDGQYHRPYMIHRALLGSMERFFAMLIENYGGAFPFWLAPMQVRLIAVNDEAATFCKELQTQLVARDIRVEVDAGTETLSKRIREGVTTKIPVLGVCGKREVESSTVNVREYGSEKQRTVSVADFVNEMVARRSGPQTTATLPPLVVSG
jgi:threonyl-tRNA synthetase